MNLSQNIELPVPAHLALAFCLVLLAAGSLSAQDVEQLYQKGLAEYSNAHVENACDAMKQVESLKPGYQQVSVYTKMACGQVPRLYQLEQDNYNQGVQYFNDGKYEDAKQAFRNVLYPKVPLNHPKYHAQAQQYVEQIDARLKDENLYQEGARLFKQGKFTEARADLTKLAQGNSPRAGDAKNLLAQVDEAERKRQKAQEEAKQQPPTPPPPQQVPVSGDQSLRAGLTAFFNGEYEHAENSLSDYLTGKGPKRQLAYFFRGAAHSAQYFLSGEKDSQEKNLALEDFRALKSQGAKFQLPEGYISPKILALYRQAAGTPSP
jgi:outer membrane protein assembly factor BamD (BamD/ComL family)